MKNPNVYHAFGYTSYYAGKEISIQLKGSRINYNEITLRILGSHHMSPRSAQLLGYGLKGVGFAFLGVSAYQSIDEWNTNKYGAYLNLYAVGDASATIAGLYGGLWGLGYSFTYYTLLKPYVIPYSIKFYEEYNNEKSTTK